MADRTARQERNEQRRRRILDAAQERADSAGWAAVTTRHLADAIGYTQPVLYGHFPGGKEEIMRTLALEGFDELARRSRDALGSARGSLAVQAVANAYLGFADEHPAVYEAMFSGEIGARFGEEGNEPELRAGFEALRSAIGDDGDGSATEVFWAALHGICTLEHAGRMRPEHRAARIAELATRFRRA
ncbi:MAG: TetR/AcrR family transcriptional regulator [Microbacterium sp.]